MRPQTEFMESPLNEWSQKGQTFADEEEELTTSSGMNMHQQVDTGELLGGLSFELDDKMHVDDEDRRPGGLARDYTWTLYTPVLYNAIYSPT
ncbi:hypothetical protein L6452_21692 [Arctium lappa]|uniref:Uncharacterized protein n=1 Tax=Arctium lappa TaxID=4217 RepID=A0ACB9AY34_ARCLA|nr:hypothetical protein L6452_21692 [Arctium lappa]